MTEISSLGLAYIGDGVFELLVRTFVCKSGKLSAKTMHKASVELVNAQKQANFSEMLLPVLTEAEHAVWLRGRNASPRSTPKGATDREYHLATALECVFGWLYLNNELDRINELFSLITATL